ncbi:MAG: DUF2974 domain-containing protein [Acholeplasmatales bacterium]|nr:DUF2974 domain-containing protein [Acholeplasmatales bacterium]
MHFKVDEVLLIENLTYLEDIPPLTTPLAHTGHTVEQMLDSIDMELIDMDREYASFVNGAHWEKMFNAIRKNKDLLETKIIDAHLDTAFGGGLGLSMVLINEKKGEAVVAFRGTALNEWTDDFLGANQIDSLQQINALEWYRKVYREYDLDRYYITITGHSKGGNKAKYITILNDTIDRCVSFDGQGFSDKFMDYYKKEILANQHKIHNHNIDFDYVNILMNDIGERTYYIGFDYGKGGFAEAHCPNKFFNFREDCSYTIEPNPDGQRPEMQILRSFIHSMIRSAVTDKDRSKNNYLVGSIVEKAFGIGSEMSTPEFISYLCDKISDEEYADNTAYLMAFVIKYSKENDKFLSSIKNIMTFFKMDAVAGTIDIIEDLLNSKKLGLLLGVSNFLITHVNKVVVKKIQSMAKKKYDIDLSKEQISRVLNLVSIVRDMLNTLELDFNGSSIEVDEKDLVVNDEDLLKDLNIVILVGGLSLERNISLHTGYMIYNELKKQGENVILLDAYMGYSDEELKIKDAFKNPEKYTMDFNEIEDDIPDLWAIKKRRIFQSNSYFGPNVLEICKQSDLVFLALNGSDGENGKIQSTFDLLGIDYTGNDYSSSARSSDKTLSRLLFKENNINSPIGYSIKKDNEIKYPRDYNLSYPVILKPNAIGIGIGTTAVIDDNGFNKALSEAFKWDDEIIVEEYITGREFSVSTINYEPSPVLEVLPLNTRDEGVGVSLKGIKAKRCPAVIDDNLSNKLKNLAIQVSKLFNLTVYSQVDFIVTENNEIYCLECNSMPKLSPYSHFSQALLEGNIDYSELCKRIMLSSLKKQIK